RCEVSNLGLRVIGNERSELAMPRLKRLVLSVFESTEERELLSFRLRGFPGVTLGQQLEQFLNSTEPDVALKTLIFLGPTQLRKAFQHLRAVHFKIADEGTDSRLIERMLWKLSFPRDGYLLNSPDPYRLWFRVGFNSGVKDPSQGNGFDYQRLLHEAEEELAPAF